MTTIAVVDLAASSSPGASGSADGQTRSGALLGGHGQACRKLIETAAPEATVVAVGLVEEDLLPQRLAAAIQGAAGKASVISVSLGFTAHPDDDFLGVVSAAAAAGVIIVAAEHNEGLVSFPAHLPSVIGVRGGEVYGEGAYYYCPGQPIECIARGDLQRAQWSSGRQVLIRGNSFAGPRIAGIVGRLKARHPDAGLDEIRALLRAGATRVIEVPCAADSGVTEVSRGPACDVGEARPMKAEGAGALRPERPFAWIGKAALYPYTKEMHAFIRFRDLLPFTVSGIADPPGRGMAGKDAGEALGVEAAGLAIRASLGEALLGADTLILGYVRQLGQLRGRDLHREHVGLALRRGLSVFSFEPVPIDVYPELHEEAQRRGLRLEWPRVTADQARIVLTATPQGGTVEVPVVGVFGTSAAQGKFTLQLALRRRLLALGYRLGQLGTEHHAALFGMDHAFPMGHGATVEMGVELYPEYLDRMMRQIRSQVKPDLILVGSQSGTVPYDVHDAATLTLPTLAFLMGAKPDACVLVVNAMDPADYVADTVDALRAVAGARVIGLAMSDRTKDLKERHGRTWVSSRRAEASERAHTLERLESRFGLPAVCITSAEGVARICEVIIETFAAHAPPTAIEEGASGPVRPAGAAGPRERPWPDGKRASVTQRLGESNPRRST